MARYKNLDDQLADLKIEEEENEDFTFEEGVEEQGDDNKIGRHMEANDGVNIKEIDPGIFLFQFYHREDLLWVCNGGPLSFDNAMLVVSKIPAREEPLNVPLWSLEIWIQIHDLSKGFMPEAVGKQLGDFFGEFVMYDGKNNASIWVEYMRVKIKLDVRKPLKRRKKIKRKNGTEFVVSCKYERLGDFCFAYGQVTHTERFCRRNLDNRGEESLKEWGGWLRALPRRIANQSRSKWLRDENDAEWEAKIGRNANEPDYTGGNFGDKGKRVAVMQDSRLVVGNKNYSADYMGERGGTILKKSGQLSIRLNGPEEEEIEGLELDSRKRSRSGPGITMDTNDVLVNSEVVIKTKTSNEADLSGMDCSTSTQTVLATLAQQASHPL
ncbi:hypothetical protein AgCh_006469 [Apium graveolens]